MSSEDESQLPEIPGVFGKGRFTPTGGRMSLHQSQLENVVSQESPEYFDLTSSTESALERWSPFSQTGQQIESPYVPGQFESQNLETSPNQLTESRFSRFFGSSKPSLSQPITEPNIGLNPISSPGVSTQSQQSSQFSSGLSHYGPNLYRSFSETNLQESGLDDWTQSILGQAPPNSPNRQQHDLWSESFGIPLDISSQSQQSSGDLQLEDWTQNILGPNISTQVPLEGTVQGTGSSDQHDYSNSKTVEEDMDIMAKKGFTITSSVSNSLFLGKFGPQIRGQTDIKGRPFTDNDVGHTFFVKFVGFDESAHMSDTKREMFDIEKYILSCVEDPNIVQMYQTFNFGGSKECKYRNNPYITFTSFDRQYMILESADLGDLEQYLEVNILSEELCISFIKQLYSGLKYLHDSSIFHCDIEPRNILLFGTNGSDITVKWCDFNIGCVLNGSHPSQPESLQSDRIVECRRFDAENLSRIIQQILMFSNPSGDTSQLVELIVDVLQNSTDLSEVNQMVDTLGANY